MAITVHPSDSVAELYSHIAKQIADGGITEFEMQGSCLIPSSPKLRDAGYVQIMADDANLVLGVRAYPGRPMLRRTFARIHARLVEVLLVQLRDFCDGITVTPLPADGIDEMESPPDSGYLQA